MNIRIRVHTKQNIPTEKDYIESKSNGGNLNAKEKSPSTYPSTLVRTDPLLRILKKTYTKNTQDKTFFLTDPPKNEFSIHDNEALMHPSVQKDPDLRILKDAKLNGKQEKSFSTSIRYRNINGNIEAHIPPQSQVHNEDYDRSKSTARQESKTKRRKQQEKKVSDTGSKAKTT